MNALKEVWVELVARFNTKDLKKGEKQLDKTIASAKKLGAALVAAFGASKLAGLFKGTVLDADETAKQARQLRISTEELEELNFIMRRLGVPAGAATQAMEELNKKIGEAKGGSEGAKKALKAIGLSVKDLDGLSKAEAFNLVLDRLRAMPDDAKRASVASQLLAEGFKSLGNAFVASQADFDSARADFAAIGGGNSNQLGKDAEFAADQFTNLELALKRLKGLFVEALLPEGAEGAAKFWERVGDILDWLSENSIVLKIAFGAVVGLIVGGLAAAAAVFAPLIVLGLKVAAVITAIGAIIGVLTADWGKLNAKFGESARKLGELLNPLNLVKRGLRFLGIGGDDVTTNVARATGRTPAPAVDAVIGRPATTTIVNNQVNHINAEGMTTAQLDSHLRRRGQSRNRAASIR